MGYIIIYANASNSITRVEISKYLNNEQIVTYIDSTLIAHEGLAKRSIPKNQEQLNSELSILSTNAKMDWVHSTLSMK